MVAKRRKLGAPNTAPRAFGAGRREKHDSRAFYDRFEAPILDDESLPVLPKRVNEVIIGDSRSMPEVEDDSVALVVTSPPYFTGKTYEDELARNGVPRSYLEYLELLRDVFRECVRCLEPGGRIAINVANLGRRPYRSLSCDVISILQDDLGLLLRGEVIWQKAEGATNSCAWGSYRKATNPVLRDTSERIIIASKGRFDRSLTPKLRVQRQLPGDSTVGADEFMRATLDIWNLPAVSAQRANHPAPFPIEIPLRLIELFTFFGDLVLDPFIGSGTTAVAAIRTGRTYFGYDIEPEFVDLSQNNIAQEVVSVSRNQGPMAVIDKMIEEGIQAVKIAETALHEAGFEQVKAHVTSPDLVPLTFEATAPAFADLACGSGSAAASASGIAADPVTADPVPVDLAPGGPASPYNPAAPFDVSSAELKVFVELAGDFAVDPQGLSKPSAAYAAISKASLAKYRHPESKFVVMTTELPRKNTSSARMLNAALEMGSIDLVVDLRDPDLLTQLRNLSRPQT